MTPKQKAQELIDTYYDIETGISTDGGYSFEKTQQMDACKQALICAKHIQSQAIEWGVVSVKSFWIEVIKEIENY